MVYALQVGRCLQVTVNGTPITELVLERPAPPLDPAPIALDSDPSSSPPGDTQPPEGAERLAIVPPEQPTDAPEKGQATDVTEAQLATEPEATPDNARDSAAIGGVAESRQPAAQPDAASEQPTLVEAEGGGADCEVAGRAENGDTADIGGVVATEAAGGQAVAGAEGEEVAAALIPAGSNDVKEAEAVEQAKGKPQRASRRLVQSRCDPTEYPSMFRGHEYDADSGCSGFNPSQTQALPMTTFVSFSIPLDILHVP